MRRIARPGEGLRREADAEAPDEVRDARRIHLERAALADQLGPGLRDASEIDEFREDALEPAGR